MKYFFPLFLIFVFTSCSIQKRLYNKGFYVSNSQTLKKPSIKDTTKLVSLLNTIKQSRKETNASLLAMAVKTIEIANKKQNLLTDPCDTIVMKTGERILGKVTKVKKDVVLFEDCYGQGYSSSAIPQQDVSQIIYAIRDNHIQNEKKKQLLIAKLIAFFLLIGFVVLYAVAFNQFLTLMVLLLFLGTLLLVAALIILLAVFISKNRE